MHPLRCLLYASQKRLICHNNNNLCFLFFDKLGHESEQEPAVE